MTDPRIPLDIADLEERVRALEKENAELSAAVGGKAHAHGSRWRAVASALLIVVASLLLPVTIVAAWARIQLVDEDAFVQTLAPLVDDPAVQQLIIDETLDAIGEQVDFEELTADVFTGLADLGLPPRAAAALQLLQAPAASGLEGLVSGAVTAVVESDAFSDVWATATRAAHRALTVSATSDGGGLVVRTDDGVGIQLGAIVERVQETLLDRDIAIAQFIPDVDRVIIVGKGEGLGAIRFGYAAAVTVGTWLPLVTLALAAGGVAIARRRSVAVVGVGIGFVLGAGSLAMSFLFGGAAVRIAAERFGLAPSALDVIYRRLVDAMTETAVVFTVIGVLLVAIGWLSGRSAAAQKTRVGVGSVNAAARRGLRVRGLDTGRVGTWLAARRVLVRVILAVLAVLWLILLRPIGFGDVVLVLLTTLLVMWVLELLQRREEEAEPDATDATLTVEESPATLPS
ncbi:hypothetical protein HDC37_001714 [Microbacterium sp. AK009]|uniref:hypothetical protein n=1 Tax=Microbacterium sp. AK009 TaxID=2723068 RepID=UPI0015CBFAD1|nr:hypothetical protein [Microbacterium sp. AK009]NYF16889.1 hypothetical protein [Microbacterium sp. AK009]